MQSSNTPAKFQIPFAASASAGYIRAIPVTAASPLAADFTSGFKPASFTPLAAGGTPPDGKDFNGILNVATSWVQRFQAGYFPAYDATFSVQIGGYPLGALLQRASGAGFWRSIAEDNVTNPDTGGAGWVLHGVAKVFGRTGDVVATAGDYTVAQVTGAVAGTDFTGGAQLLATNGHQLLPGGLLWQWGQTASIPEDTETPVTFPIPFPTACFNVQATADYGGHTDSDVIAQVTNITTTGVKIMRDSGGGSGYNGVVYWFAIGH